MLNCKLPWYKFIVGCVCISGLMACSAPKDNSPIGSGSDPLCNPSDCGLVPEVKCFNGTDPVARRCLRKPSGQCAWESQCGSSTPSDASTTTCFVTGCHRQLCADHVLESSCKWQDEFTCYKNYGICERQANGQCNWRDTLDLTACIAKGKPCSNSSECAANEYCAPPLNKCIEGSNATGICSPKPTADCPNDVQFVCGCNNTTYINPCEAAKAGVGYKHEGRCAGPQPTSCGGVLGSTCPTSMYCDYSSGFIKCNTIGVCKERPTTCSRIEEPVCSCNNKTYKNECEAAKDGQAINHQGVCK